MKWETNRCILVPTTSYHIVELSETINNLDAHEVWAMSHTTPLEAISRCVDISDEPTTFVHKESGNVLCMCGVQCASFIQQTGVPWMLGSQELSKYWFDFLRVSKAWVAYQQRQYKQLYNYVVDFHTVSIKWLQWLGFVITESRPMGVEHNVWHRMELEGLS